MTDALVSPARQAGSEPCANSPGARSHLEGAKLRAARARFADALGERSTDSAVLGSIVLRPDQLVALRRVRTGLSADGGCLLADDPGTGKTYIALAAARDWRDPLVVIPASLRSTWMEAMKRAGVSCALVTHEALSRGALPDPRCDGIVVDESHRFRPTSRRHAALARIARDAPVLLLSATPLQNRPPELAAQLALFLGEGAYHLESAALARYVVRGRTTAAAELPAVAPPRWIAVRADDGDVLRGILALPPPPRAVDMGDGGALLAISLVRAWASSRAALLATLRRRRRTLVAMEQCREEGRVPTRRELRAWTGGDGVQLGFASLLAESSIDSDAARHLAAALSAERGALDALQTLLAQIEDPDIERAAALRRLRAAHRGESILAFSESASTIGAYFRALGADAGVGMLTAREARIASGRIGRDELLARFAPRAQGVRAPPERERVTLLLTTDLLSEGVNLQDASVVVHLDLPWNPARLAQRVGRVRRPGGAAEVFGYLMAPPAGSSLLLRAEARLRAKLAQAERTIGRGLEVMPALGLVRGAIEREELTRAETESRERLDGAPEQEASPPGAEARQPATQSSDAELRGEIDRLLASWRRRAPSLDHRTPAHPDRTSRYSAAQARSERSDGAHPHCIVAAVRSDVRGWLAALDDGRIVASLSPCDRESAARGGDEDVSAHVAWMDEDPSLVAHALRSADGDPALMTDHELAHLRAEVDHCLTRDWIARSCGGTVAAPTLRRTVRRRLDAAMRAVARHRRAHAFALAARLRDRLDSPMPLGTERALVKHAAARASASANDGEEWIVAALALVERSRAPSARQLARRSEATAIIVLGPGS
ncbi:MAG TPA: helicase-related protein [Gemmatimonadaceae bacterium]|nr:helicase-related protein [Gemmatimonadaceae bacterium]